MTGGSIRGSIPVVAVGLVAAVVGACGYSLVGRGAAIPERISEVYVDTLRNETRRSEVGQILTSAISEELVTRKRFDVVADRAEADAVLSGAVVRFDAQPLNFDAEGRAIEYQIVITARVDFAEPGAETPLWANTAYEYRQNYEVEESEASYFDREKLAIEEAAGRFARTLVIDLLEGF